MFVRPIRSLPRIAARSFHTSFIRPNSTPSRPQKNAENGAQKHVQTAKDYLRNLTGDTAVAVRRHADGFTASTASLFSQLGGQLNKATGYEDIELLKKKVVDQESRINITRLNAGLAKKAYEEAVSRRSQSQRDVNELLQRKSSWTDADVVRFTTLVREDHSFEQEEARTKVAVAESDAQVDKELNELMRSILARYHEEQVWSDKIRSASTYGSLAALGLNLFVFIMATLVVEPWKRRRLAQTFEKKVEELSAETKALIEAETQELHTQMKGFGTDSHLGSLPVPHVVVVEQTQTRSLRERLLADPELQILIGAVVLMNALSYWH